MARILILTGTWIRIHTEENFRFRIQIQCIWIHNTGKDLVSLTKTKSMVHVFTRWHSVRTTTDLPSGHGGRGGAPIPAENLIIAAAYLIYPNPY